MSDPASPPRTAAEPGREELMAGLFANLVRQHTQLGLMLLGKTPRPDSGRPARDLDHAQTVIEQLEMIAVKTKGNLSKDEAGLLQQSLMTLRLAFVEEVDAAPSPPAAGTAPAGQPGPAATAEAPPSTAPAAEAESKKKFTKKY